jgi:hypothetical protein
MVEHQSDQGAFELSQVQVADPADRSFVGRGFWLTAGCVVARSITAHSMTRAVAGEPPAKVVTSEQTRHRPAGSNQWRADSRTETLNEHRRGSAPRSPGTAFLHPGPEK